MSCNVTPTKVIANYVNDKYVIANYVTANYDRIIHVTANNATAFFVRELCKMRVFSDYGIFVLLWSYFTGNTLIIVRIYQIKKGLHTCELA